MFATPFIALDLQSLILKGDFSKTLKMLLHKLSPIVRSQSVHLNNLPLGFPSNTYCKIITSCSMFAESVNLDSKK